MIAGLLLLLAVAQEPATSALQIGPAVGAAIPPFQAPDQDGRARSFGDLRGPQGLVLLFFRSADW